MALAAARAQQYDSDLEVEELPPLKQVLGDDVCKKLKPKEKKRQEVINGKSGGSTVVCGSSVVMETQLNICVVFDRVVSTVLCAFF